MAESIVAAGRRKWKGFMEVDHSMRREGRRSRRRDRRLPSGVPGCKPAAVRDGEGCFRLYSTRSVRQRYRSWTPCSNWNS